jgi:hypothetical protein
MSHPVTLSAQETSERLIAVLRDYAEKLSALNEQAAETGAALDRAGGYALPAESLNAARLIYLQETIDKSLSPVTQHASGMLENSDIDQVIWQELKLRLDEVEEHLRFSRFVAVSLAKSFRVQTDADTIRNLVVRPKTKAPF